MKRGKKIPYICTVNTRGVGELSSKYAYDKDGKQFEADIQRSIERTEKLYAEFVEWIKSKDVDPSIFRGLFRRYYEEFIES